MLEKLFLSRVREEKNKPPLSCVFNLESAKEYEEQNQLPVRSSGHFSEPGVLLPVLHVEQAFHVAETAGDVVLGLVGLTVVDFGQFCRVADEEECR